MITLPVWMIYGGAVACFVFGWVVGALVTHADTGTPAPPEEDET